MARVYITSADLKILYTNDQAVGTGCPNRKDDVLLVQFFLKVISEGPQKSQYAPAGRPPMKCDGLWGSNSQAYLNQYISANSAANPGAPLTADGRVDPVAGGKFLGSRTGNLYTILALNKSYSLVRGQAMFSDITTDGVFPPDLKSSLKVG